MQLVFDPYALVVALSILAAAWMWGLEWRLRYPIPIWEMARIFMIALSIQFAIYSLFSFLLIDVQLRVYLVRTSIIVVCLAQAIPLFIAYRTWNHGAR